MILFISISENKLKQEEQKVTIFVSQKRARFNFY